MTSNWKINNPDYFKNYYIKNKEKLDAYHKQYKQQNAEAIKKYHKTYNKTYFQKIKENNLKKKVTAFKNTLISQSLNQNSNDDNNI